MCVRERERGRGIDNVEAGELELGAKRSGGINRGRKEENEKLTAD